MENQSLRWGGCSGANIVENQSLRGGGCSGANMVEIQSLRGVVAAEPTWGNNKTLEGWVKQSQYGGKQSLRGVGAAEPI